VRPVGGELDRLPGEHRVVVAVDGDNGVAVQDVQHLARPRRMIRRLVAVAGGHPPVPELDERRLVESGEQPTATAVRAPPEHGRIVRRRDADRPLVVRLDQLTDRHAHGVRDPAQRPQAGIRAGGLDLHEHALADPGPAGELVQGPAAGGPQRADPGGHRGGQFLEPAGCVGQHTAPSGQYCGTKEPC
jgi:hypothetical protein